MTDWKHEAQRTGLPCFPIHIVWDDAKQKWNKKPLINTWQRVTQSDLEALPWGPPCNGYGMVMGNGVYAIDMDTYKEESEARAKVAEWDLPLTRVHKTVSGGMHLIFSLPTAYPNLPTRNKVVAGMETRGRGGFIAFGEGYELAVDTTPVELPVSVCTELLAGYHSSKVSLPPEGFVDEPVVRLRLMNSMEMGGVKFNRRWRGAPEELSDTSASGWDHSISHLLAREGFSYPEIVWILENLFEHGVVARDGLTRVTQRAVRRSAAKAVRDRDTRREKMLGVYQ